jgi:hypothetical protein
MAVVGNVGGETGAGVGRLEPVGDGTTATGCRVISVTVGTIVAGCVGRIDPALINNKLCRNEDKHFESFEFFR